MIIRTSYGEIGHCDKCGADCNSYDLWVREIEYCRNCDAPLYADDNPEHCIPEDVEKMEAESWQHFEKDRDRMFAACVSDSKL